MHWLMIAIFLCKNDVIEPDLVKWPPLRKTLNFISTTEQDLLFILFCVATMYWLNFNPALAKFLQYLLFWMALLEIE